MSDPNPSPPGVEIERKWVVGTMPDLTAARATTIRQGYLAANGDGEVRIRRRDDACTLTVKHGAGLLRGEVDIPIATSLFEDLWPRTDGARVSKVRHELPLEDGLIAEIDVFDGHLAGLVLAEVEFPSERAALAFSPPAWIGTDVTEDGRYKNKALAVAAGPPRSVR